MQRDGTWPTSTMTDEMAPGPASMGIPAARYRIFFRRGFFGVAVVSCVGEPACFEHVQADQQQDQAAGNFKGRQSNAEHAEDELSAMAKLVSTMKQVIAPLRAIRLRRAASALSVMARNDGMAANGSTRKKMELSASNEKRTIGA